MKKYYALTLLPTRADFAQTMTENERAIMQQHIVYWKDYMDKGMVVVFGPVLNPAATYGLGVVCVDNEDDVKQMIANDPAATINRYEYYPMMAIVPQH